MEDHVKRWDERMFLASLGVKRPFEQDCRAEQDRQVEQDCKVEQDYQVEQGGCNIQPPATFPLGIPKVPLEAGVKDC
jgi:hypothetical protein